MNNKIIILLKDSITEFNKDNGTLLAASISFSLLLSLFPLAFVAVYGAGSITTSRHIQELVIRGITYLLPESQGLIASVTGNSTMVNQGISAVALIGLIWGGISFFNSVRISLNLAWGIRNPHSLFRAQLINMAMMLGAGILLLLSVLLTFTLSSVRGPGINVGGILISHAMALRILSNVMVTLLSFVVFLSDIQISPKSATKMARYLDRGFGCCRILRNYQTCFCRIRERFSAL